MASAERGSASPTSSSSVPTHACIDPSFAPSLPPSAPLLPFRPTHPTTRLPPVRVVCSPRSPLPFSCVSAYHNTPITTSGNTTNTGANQTILPPPNSSPTCTPGMTALFPVVTSRSAICSPPSGNNSGNLGGSPSCSSHHFPSHLIHAPSASLFAAAAALAYVAAESSSSSPHPLPPAPIQPFSPCEYSSAPPNPSPSAPSAWGVGDVAGPRNVLRRGRGPAGLGSTVGCAGCPAAARPPGGLMTRFLDHRDSRGLRTARRRHTIEFGRTRRDEMEEDLGEEVDGNGSDIYILEDYNPYNGSATARCEFHHQQSQRYDLGISSFTPSAAARREAAALYGTRGFDSLHCGSTSPLVQTSGQQACVAVAGGDIGGSCSSTNASNTMLPYSRPLSTSITTNITTNTSSITANNTTGTIISATTTRCTTGSIGGPDDSPSAAVAPLNRKVKRRCKKAQSTTTTASSNKNTTSNSATATISVAGGNITTSKDMNVTGTIKGRAMSSLLPCTGAAGVARRGVEGEGESTPTTATAFEEEEDQKSTNPVSVDEGASDTSRGEDAGVTTDEREEHTPTLVNIKNIRKNKNVERTSGDTGGAAAGGKIEGRSGNKSTAIIRSGASSNRTSNHNIDNGGRGRVMMGVGSDIKRKNSKQIEDASTNVKYTDTTKAKSTNAATNGVMMKRTTTASSKSVVSKAGTDTVSSTDRTTDSDGSITNRDEGSRSIDSDGTTLIGSSSSTVRNTGHRGVSSIIYISEFLSTLRIHSLYLYIYALYHLSLLVFSSSFYSKLDDTYPAYYPSSSSLPSPRYGVGEWSYWKHRHVSVWSFVQRSIGWVVGYTLLLKACQLLSQRYLQSGGHLLLKRRGRLGDNQEELKEVSGGVGREQKRNYNESKTSSRMDLGPSKKNASMAETVNVENTTPTSDFLPSLSYFEAKQYSDISYMSLQNSNLTVPSCSSAPTFLSSCCPSSFTPRLFSSCWSLLLLERIYGLCCLTAILINLSVFMYGGMFSKSIGIPDIWLGYIWEVLNYTTHTTLSISEIVVFVIGFGIDVIGLYILLRSVCIHMHSKRDIFYPVFGILCLLSLGKYFMASNPSCNSTDFHWVDFSAHSADIDIMGGMSPNYNPLRYSVYFTMSDKTKLAADIYLPKSYLNKFREMERIKEDRHRNGYSTPPSSKDRFHLHSSKEVEESYPPLPTYMEITRYDRRMATIWPFSLLSIWGEPADSSANVWSWQFIQALIPNGYAVVVVDSRGTGASQGHREVDFSSEELRDFGEIIDKIKQQWWCNGKIAMGGISYDGMTGLQAASRGGVNAAVALFTPMDVIGDLLAPGGMVCSSFVRDYVGMTAKFEEEGTPLNHLLNHPWHYPLHVILGFISSFGGALPVHREVALGASVLQEHERNWDMGKVVEQVEYLDDNITLTDGRTLPVVSFGITEDVMKGLADNQVSVYIAGGYCDSAIVRGSARLFDYLRTNAPTSHPKLVVGPWTHAGRRSCSPYNGNYPCFEESIYFDLVRYLDCRLKSHCWGGIDEEPPVHYWQIGEERWQSSSTYPPRDRLAYQEFSFSKRPLSADLRPLAVREALVMRDGTVIGQVGGEEGEWKEDEEEEMWEEEEMEEEMEEELEELDGEMERSSNNSNVDMCMADRKSVYQSLLKDQQAILRDDTTTVTITSAPATHVAPSVRSTDHSARGDLDHQPAGSPFFSPLPPFHSPSFTSATSPPSSTLSHDVAVNDDSICIPRVVRQTPPPSLLEHLVHDLTQLTYIHWKRPGSHALHHYARRHVHRTYVMGEEEKLPLSTTIERGRTKRSIPSSSSMASDKGKVVTSNEGKKWRKKSKKWRKRSCPISSPPSLREHQDHLVRHAYTLVKRTVSDSSYAGLPHTTTRKSSANSNAVQSDATSKAGCDTMRASSTPTGSNNTRCANSLSSSPSRSTVHDILTFPVDYQASTGIFSRWLIAQHPFRMAINYGNLLFPTRAAKPMRQRSETANGGPGASQTGGRRRRGFSGRWGTPRGAPKAENSAFAGRLSFTTSPLMEEVAMVGSPWVKFSVYVSGCTEMSVFAYLEDVDISNGYSHYVTEGKVVASHRVSGGGEDRGWGEGQYSGGAGSRIYVGSPDMVFRSFTKKDYLPVQGSELLEMSLTLEPTSWTFQRGHAIRLSLTGSDVDNFELRDHAGIFPALPDFWQVVVNDHSNFPAWIRLPTLQAEKSL